LQKEENKGKERDSSARNKGELTPREAKNQEKEKSSKKKDPKIRNVG